MKFMNRNKSGIAFILAGIFVFITGLIFYGYTYHQVQASILPTDSLFTAQNFLLFNTGVGAIFGAYGTYADWRINTGRVKIRKNYR